MDTDEDVLWGALVELVDKGKIAAHCPLCTKTLEPIEHETCKCRQCGEIEMDDIRYWAVS